MKLYISYITLFLVVISKPAVLKYVYSKDALGGEQGAFYSTENKLVYRTILSLGE